MLELIRQCTKENVVDDLRTDFSIGTNFEKIFSVATIMTSFKEYFSYGRLICGCGIREVRFMGTLDDWNLLLTKTSGLKKYADKEGKWKKYLDGLIPILNKFIDTYNGKVDLKFWNTIMATEIERIGSGGETATYVHGWINTLFGYDRKVDFEEVSNEYINVPLKLSNDIMGTVDMLNIIGGFTGASYENGAYRPQLSMVIYKFE